MRLTQFAMRFGALRFVTSLNHPGHKTTSVRMLAMMAFLSLLVCGGCANFQEKRTISAFQAGLEAGNLETLREKATSRFARKVLRHPESDDAIAQLKLPEGKFDILEVEDVSKTEKKVTIGFGEEHKRKIMYRLVNDEQKQWKIDDIYLRQRKGRKTIAMPVSEQMDVLLSAREFYESWSMGNRERVLSSSNPELKTALGKLPPSVLAYNISQLIGKTDRTRSFRPEAHINGNQAVVKLNRSHGTIQISMEQNESGWQVSDLALTGRDDSARIDSLLNRVKVTNQTMAFLDAWQQNDKATLKQLTQEKFFNAGLAPSRLSDVPLPSSFEVEGKVDVKLSDSRADVILNNQKQTLQITLKQKEDNAEEYVISDIILYDMEKEQNLSLVSALTARPVAELFMKSWNQRDPKMLQYNSTRDFYITTWGRASKKTLAILPFPVQELSAAHVTGTRFQGEITYIDFETATDQLTVVLHDQGGRVLVDDVLIQSKKSPQSEQKISLKNHLSAIVPVYELASRIHHDEPMQAVRLVTDDFYNRVFSLTKKMPDSAYTFLSNVSSSEPQVQFPQTTSRAETNRKKSSRHLVIEFDTSSQLKTLVSFSGQNSEMQVTLIEEDGLLRISDALLNAPNGELTQQLKQTMRMELAQQRTQNMVRTVSAVQRKSSFRGKQPATLHLIPRQKTHITARNNSPMPIPMANDAERIEKPLKNALYEQYETARPTNQVHPAEYTLKPQATLSVERQANKAINPPREHQFEDHLLLKQIPIQ